MHRRESVALKIVTDGQQDTITMRLSEGRLVYVNCEGRGPLDALVLLTECARVQFSYSSRRAVDRNELMSPDAFLHWIDSAGDMAPDTLGGVGGTPSTPSSPASDAERWSGTLRGHQERKKGSAGLVAAAIVVTIAIAAVGFYVTSGTSWSGSAGRADVEIVDAAIVGSTTWQTGRTYRLEGVVIVESGARLIIEPGVTVLGGSSAALVVVQGGSIHARGSATEPIVLTSARPEGQRAGGDWGGLVLLGDAPINRNQAHFEAIAYNDARGVFGGSSRMSSCGVLEFVRIEFAGDSISTNNKLGGLTLAGCGSGKLVERIQVHRADDDGVEILGGAVDLKHILVTHPGDDAFDWDMGWTGRAQFLIAQQHPERGENVFEGKNWNDNPEAHPVSQPRIYNATVVGSRNVNRNQRAIIVQHGSGGEFHNILITGFPLEPIDLRGTSTAARIASRALAFSNIVLVKSRPEGQSYFAYEFGTTDDDGGLDERQYFSEVAPDVFFDATEALSPDAWNLTASNFTPIAAYIGAGSNKLPPTDEEFWDQTANYYGAVRYGEQALWTHGWTAYPER